MPETDHPLKELILAFKEVFVAWLLGSAPEEVRPLNVELLASAARSDLVFEVLQADGQLVLLHIELQGRRSHAPMPLRMLDYMSRLTGREGSFPARMRLNSVVIYIGQGAGQQDSGQHLVLAADGQPCLAWRYQVIRLEAGLEEGLVRGREAGLEEGILEGMRESILEAVTFRFDPAVSQYRHLSQQLDEISDRQLLQQVLTRVIQAEDMADFMAALAALLSER